MSSATVEPAQDPGQELAAELDVFLSYSRRDARFVTELANALEQRGRTVWIDADDIAPGAPWREELGTAIEAAQVFVFVISPDSIASAECAVELARAIELNKRLVPILHREHADVPAALAELQFIPIHDAGELATGLDLVERAIDTDHDWVRAHTHWGARALRWAERDRDRSLLLRGQELRTAETWLAQQAEGSTPRPTQLQTTFIVTSRQAERRRLRTLVGAALFAVAVASTLAVIALLARSEAVDQRDQARSRELAAHAVSQLDVDPERSLLLALASDDVVRTPQTVDAMRRALTASRVRATMRGHRRAVTRALFVSGVERIVTASLDGTARLWDRHGRPLALMRHDRAVNELAATPDGRVLATASDDGTARVWDGRRGRAVATLEGHRGAVSAAALDRRGRWVATAGEDATVRIWNARSGAQRAVLRGHRGPVLAAAVSPNGRQVLSGGRDGSVRLWNLRSHRGRVVQRSGYPIDTVEFSANGREALTLTRAGRATTWHVRPWRRDAVVTRVFSAGLNADGTRLIAGSNDGRAQVLPAAGEGARSVLSGHGETIFGVSFSADGRLAATAGVDRTARVWDASTERNLAVLRGHAGTVHRAFFSPDKRTVVTASEDGTARLWDVAQPIVLRGRGSMAAGGAIRIPVKAAEMSPDGRYVITARDLSARLWDPRRGREIRASPQCRQPGRPLSCIEETSLSADTGLHPLNDVTWSPDGRRIVTAGSSGVAHVFDPFSGRKLVDLVGHVGALQSVRFSADGTRILTAGDDGTARVWRARDGRQLALLRAQPPAPAAKDERGFAAAAFSPDGRRVATGGADGAVRIFDIASRRQIAAHRIDSGIVLDVDWSVDDRIAAPVGDTARVWRVDGWRAGAVLRGHDGLVSRARFSPDGSLLVTGGYDGTARVWDVAAADQVTVLGGHEQTVTSVRMSHTGRFVVTSSEDGSARVHRCDACGPLRELAGLAQARVTRKLTSEERRRYLDKPSA